MSGLASLIRLSMFNKRTLLLESHTIPGGLNSYYSRGKYKFDVGLHALTNYVSKEDRSKPLNKLLKQLRIPYSDLKLIPQNHSKINFIDQELKFNNNIELLISEVKTYFPSEIDGFVRLIHYIENYNEVDLNSKTFMAKDVVRTFIKSPLLLEMVFCPLLIYGSAWENDMDFSQFAIMFKSIYLEGFSRPTDGVRTIIDLLLKKFDETKHESGSEIRFKNKVTKIITENNKIIAVEVNNAEIIKCNNILSSMGIHETMAITQNTSNESNDYPKGQMSFAEAILVLDQFPQRLNIDSTIIFYNDGYKYEYRKPSNFFDEKSAVICFPNNFQYGNQSDTDVPMIRLTHIANFDLFRDLKLKSKQEYKEKKEEIILNSKTILKKIGITNPYEIIFSDVFTPDTITRYTGHTNGCVYGSTLKVRDGKTNIDGLYIMGTDQGFLGIIGSMLSGISMANLHVLQGGQ